MDGTRKTGGPSPELRASLLSFVTWSWMEPLISLGNRKPLEAKDLYDMNPNESSEHCEQLWKRALEKAKYRQQGLSAWRLLWDCFGMEYLRLGVFKPVWLIAAITQVYILKALVKIVADAHNFTWWWGAILVFGMFATSVVLSLTQLMCLALSEKVGMKIRSTVSMIVFDKLLNMKLVHLAGTNSGEMLNIVTNDTQALLDASKYIHFCWFAVIELFVIGILAISEAGISAIPGVVIALFTQPVQILMARMGSRLRAKAVSFTDARVHLTGEVLNGIRVIKYNGWVMPFLRRIADIRCDEICRIKKSAYVRSATSTIKDLVTPLASLATFGTYYATHGGKFMPTSQAFTVLALFSVMSRTFTISPLGLLTIGEAIVAVRRLQKLLDLDKVVDSGVRDDRRMISKDHPHEGVAVVNCSFSWENNKQQCIRSEEMSRKKVRTTARIGHERLQIDTKEIDEKDANIQLTGLKNQAILVEALHDINLSVQKGESASIYGPVGSGKSSLLYAILGEMQCLKGELYVQRSIALVPQQPWILNDTVRRNIILVNRFDPDRYQRTIAACALEHDISQLVGGHDAEIGERGFNLSGGQKARISLARACYSSAPVILLDDPFSAVDVPTAKHLIEHVLNGILKGRTVILVTHNKMALTACKHIYSMENGHLLNTTKSFIEKTITSEVGQYPAIDIDNKNEATTLVNNSVRQQGEEQESPEYQTFESRMDEAKGRATVVEDQNEGKIQLSTWLTYAKALGGFHFFSFVMCLFIVSQAVRVMVDYWLRIWTQKSNHLKPEFYMEIYGCIVLGSTVLALSRGLLFRYATMIAATELHNKMAERVLRSPQLFFDQNVAGRILNRFSKDQALVDEALPSTAQQMLEYVVPSLGSLIITGVLIPWFLLSFPFMFIFFIYIQRRYIAVSRQLKRLEAVSRSPMYTHFSQTLEGIVSVRAYGTQSEMHKVFLSLIDANHRPFILFGHMTRWLGVKLDFATCLCVTFATVLVIILRNSISPGLAGVVLVQSLQVTSVIQFGVRQMAETENNLTSVERIEAYANLPSEAEPTTQPGIIDANWPSRGEIEFKDYTMTYRVDLPPVLNNISFKVNASEKIGILGRTGVGKSSLAAAIFRMIENEMCSGSIIIDGVNIKLVGLDDLRQRLSIIPQDPILFKGTVRFNLDPFQAYTDPDIYEALERVHLSDKIRSLDRGLDSIIAKNGENFSLGQRQLICLARSILRRSKIVVMDEATASVDGETDKLIQQTLRSKFRDCTVLTIAHRIETIIDCNRVLLLKAGGQIAEFDSPINLLDHHQGGVFSEMVRQSGPVLSQKLYEAAQAATAAAASNKDC